MGLDLRISQSLQLQQKLVMTPQLQLAIKLLQLSRLELAEKIGKELQENPTLEEAMESPVPEGERPEHEPKTPDKVEEVKGKDEGIGDLDWKEYLGEYMPTGVRTPYEDEQRQPIENRLTAQNSLFEHLKWQLRFSPWDEEDLEVGGFIIGNIDDDGYLQGSTEEIALKLEISEERVLEVLEKVQKFDPVGIAARDLKECLLIQTRHLQLEGSLIESIINNHLPDLEQRKYKSICKTLGISRDELREAMVVVSSLDPKPGRAYGGQNAEYITPDIEVRKIGEEFFVDLNEDGLPKLKISAYYHNLLTNKDATEEEKQYVQDKLRSAQWLIKSINQRQRTIYKVAKSIIQFQSEFLEKGTQFLKPLVLRDVAEDIDMHESTVSRVTTNKYINTPQGIFELKYFFKSAIHSTDGDRVSSESVKERIRQIISKEDSKKPVSDQAIVEILQKEEIDIARRTVAKYREMMDIPSSTKRNKVL